MDVHAAELELNFSHAELQVVVEHDVGQYQRRDGRRPPDLARFDVGLVPQKRGAREGRGDDVAVVEYRVAGDVIEVPMAKDRGEFPNPQLFEIAAHEFRMGHAGEGIVDNGLRAAVDGVHGCAEL